VEPQSYFMFSMINPAPPSPTFGGPYGFSADVDGQDISSITAPRVSGPISVPEPFSGGAFFAALVNVNPNATLPGSLNAAYYAVSTSFTISAVPEPSTCVLALAGIGLLGFAARRRLS
jgi:hypothetical protein